MSRQQNIGSFSYNNVNTNHPIINNSQEYIIYKKYVSIHSEDRDINKYPKSNAFEIELPEDYLNVYKMNLRSWTFPSNYNTFSIFNNNITLIFQIDQPYNPIVNGLANSLQIAIYEALNSKNNNTNLDKNFMIQIEEGFYNPTQMTTELTNKMNETVTNYIINYFTNNGYSSLISSFEILGGYQEFIVVYNNVSQKIWFGNSSSGFIFKNSLISVSRSAEQILDSCLNGDKVPDYSNWGLPANLGLTRCDATSIETTNINDARFYYGDVFPGDNGYWLLPNPSLPNSSMYYVTPIYKINLMGPSEFYLCIDGYNCIDETSPYNLSKFTMHTNQTNSIVNGSFAKIPVTCTPISQFYDNSDTNQPYKLFYPPAERIRKLQFKLRYHDGSPVDFGLFNYSFVLEFELLVPQVNRSIRNLNADYNYFS
jgi:hypothetical protein